MANGSNNDLAGSISALMDTFAKLGQQQLEMLNSGIKAASEMVEPLGKTMTDLGGNVVNTVNQVLQNVSSNLGGGSSK
ncbi:chlorosome envelope protein B [Chlorobaculum limnaeum]|uniref:Chlorosome envelope protein B n=1 Tax=Chlorobaculum limnaeum TaxID=274537 RepID=A0A1D8D2C0_CHLLM|nr:chlorosome envelope protein B [Chlorobaculum limnaeum]AOS84621.1 chlorosome envelope protein B [Chlorobaculum limnaeum]